MFPRGSMDLSTFPLGDTEFCQPSCFPLELFDTIPMGFQTIRTITFLYSSGLYITLGLVETQ